MTTMPDCRFCLDNKLFMGELLAETDAAFLVPPKDRGNDYLIIPKFHVEDPAKLPDDWWKHMNALLPKIPNLAESYNISLNYGQPAGQTIRHLHFWVINRYEGEKASGIGLARLITLRNEE